MANARSIIHLDLPGLEQLTADVHRLAEAAQHTDSAAAVAIRAIQMMREAGEQRDRNAAERDGAYRERAQLLALLATHYPAVLAPAPDIDEDGWQILYLTTPTGQATWHIAPRDADLFDHVSRVTTGHSQAQWDGHTTEQKHERIAELTQLRGDSPAVAAEDNQP